MTPYYQLIHGDNLETLKQLKADGQRFDLVELDGPYMAGLEDWDNLTEAQYIQHYADRLTLVRDILQPWGVVFVFGYPEGCAEIKSWAHRSGTLYLRRWISWYKTMTAHQPRRIEAILVFSMSAYSFQHFMNEFSTAIKAERIKRNLSLKNISQKASELGHCQWWHRGGTFYFETGSHGGDRSGKPSLNDLIILSAIFELDLTIWKRKLAQADAYSGLTNIDYITTPHETNVHLSDRLRSKPVQLYLDLFRPTIPPTDNRTALILYGGSGNAGIAAAALGYDVTICETDPARCEAIKGRWDRDVIKWQQRARAIQGSLFTVAEPEQTAMDLAA